MHMRESSYMCNVYPEEIGYTIMNQQNNIGTQSRHVTQKNGEVMHVHMEFSNLWIFHSCAVKNSDAYIV